MNETWIHLQAFWNWTSTDDLLSYLFSAGGVCDSLLRHADCGPVPLAGYLYTHPSYHTPAERRGHAVKNFLTHSQDSWQTYFSCWKVQELHCDLLIWLQACVPVGEEGRVSGSKAACQSPVVCVWNLQVNPATRAKRSSAQLLLFHIKSVSHCGELNVEHSNVTCSYISLLP